MSGHSKWHNIQKTKGAADAKRSAAFTKIAREIIVAVKTGGSGDPKNNSKLATVITKAKAVNMPKDNIKRTIDKALASGNSDSYENLRYEGYGPSGVAVIVDVLTDNRNRTRRTSGICLISTTETWGQPAVSPGRLTARGRLSLIMRTEIWMKIPS